jgi:hypothetical protein
MAEIFTALAILAFVIGFFNLLESWHDLEIPNEDEEQPSSGIDSRDRGIDLDMQGKD